MTVTRQRTRARAADATRCRCGAYRLTATVTVEPCGCSEKLCPDCASETVRAQLTVTANGLKHACGHEAPMNVWKITRKVDA